MLLNQYQEFINNNFNNTNIKTVSEQDDQIDVKFYTKQDLWYSDGSSDRKIPAGTLAGETFLVNLSNGTFENMLEEESEEA